MEGLLQKCPIDTCDVDIALDRVTCTAHWYMVPKPLRDRVWSAWRKRQRERGSLERSIAVREHDDAKAAAIAAVNAKIRGQ